MTEHWLKLKATEPVFNDPKTAGVTIISNNRHIHFSNAMFEELKQLIMKFEVGGRAPVQNYVEPERIRFEHTTPPLPRKARLEDLI